MKRWDRLSRGFRQLRWGTLLVTAVQVSQNAGEDVMGGPSLFFRTDDRPLTEMTRKVRRALGKADTRELLETIGEEVAATTRLRAGQGSGWRQVAYGSVRA